MNQKSKIYLASDFHLGLDSDISSVDRELHIVRWLDHISEDALTIYLLGDVFDYWFEYKMVVPRGYVRLFSKLMDLKDKGIKVHFLKGNHDLWIGDYFQSYLGIEVHSEPLTLKWNERNIFLAHGDGLGPGDVLYKISKLIFRNAICQKLFSWIHPDFGLRLMRFSSRKSRHAQAFTDGQFDAAKEPIIRFCEDYIKLHKGDFTFVTGHRHFPVEHVLSDGVSRYINLGDWVDNFTYGVWDGQKISLAQFPYPT